jgi:type IV pilus assembly protein PilM
MANTNAVWGIDIGQCALKALRCRPHEKEENRLVVEAFDYIEYPKILTQPEANRDELIREALQTFVSRNDVAGDSVAIAVPGQSGLARFIKLPPVERKKIPDIVKYEARQQIPFALEDVVWDYQPLIGSEDEGYAIETEVGLFAMKRDQVARALKPLDEAGIPVDIIQLAPLSIYNFICFDRMKLEGAYDPANPPQSTVIISLGTDTTDLVITNGYRVWQRSIPIGGNHFTKALTKELKLTFAKAEHLKRNAMKAENPKAVFQAMRPVFSDLVAEIQRSIGFFTSNNRNAKLGDMIALGNPMKLPGLQRFLSQNLDQEVKLVDQFNNLVGGSATAGPAYKENQLTFGVAYGLCVQALDQAQLRTNLLPEEIITKRLVKAKKPWAVAAAALLMVGLGVNYWSHYMSVMSANVDDPAMKTQLSAAATAQTTASGYATTHTGLTAKFDEMLKLADNLQSNVDGRLLWLELLKAIDTALPKDTRPEAERKETAEDIAARKELHIEQIDCEYFADLTAWKTSVQKYYQSPKTEKPAAVDAGAEGGDLSVEGGETQPAEGETAPDGGAPAEPPAPDAPAPETPPTDAGATPPTDATAPVPDPNAAIDPALAGAAPAIDPGTGMPVEGAAPALDPVTGLPIDGAAAGGPDLTKGGWVIQMVGHHFHNSLPDQPAVGDEATQFVIKTFCKELENGTVKLPDGEKGELVDVKISDLGIAYPTVVTRDRLQRVQYAAESLEAVEARQQQASREAALKGTVGAAATPVAPIEPKTFDLRQYNFIVQFIWQPTSRSKRQDKANGVVDPAAEAAGTAAVDAGTPTGT